MQRNRKQTDREDQRPDHEAGRPGRPVTEPEPGSVFSGLHDSIGNCAVGRRIQAKMAVSQSGDPLEIEADRILRIGSSRVRPSRPPASVKERDPAPSARRNNSR
jgi:hypothetical protein